MDNYLHSKVYVDKKTNELTILGLKPGKLCETTKTTVIMDNNCIREINFIKTVSEYAAAASIIAKKKTKKKKQKGK